MPEGDVVWRTARRLDAALTGQALTHADLRWPGLSTADLSGWVVAATVARGKHLLTRLERPGESPLTLHSHLRMDGGWRIDRTPSSRGQWHTGGRGSTEVRAVLANPDWTASGTRLGMLDLVRTGEEHTLVGHLGPDVLGPDWDLEVALANLSADPARPVGAALLDQRVLAGIGTFYLAETMFLVARTPWTPIVELTGEERRRVLERAHRLLHLNRDRVVQVTTGDARPGHDAFVHGRSGRPCRRCGTAVRVAQIGVPPFDRVAFYCPTCQRGPAPTDDGHPQQPLGAGRAQRPVRPGRRAARTSE